jgi:hypothetical protein
MRWSVVLGSLLTAACGFRAPTGGAGDAGVVDGRPGEGGASNWWNTAWSARQQISINSPMTLPQGFQIGVRRDLDTEPCSGPRNAVRVVRNHTTELTRVIDELGADEWIWFRLVEPLPASTGPSEYWLYCGNPSAGPAMANPVTVFDLYDDFDGASLSSTWNMQGAVTVGGGAVTVGGNNAGIHSVTSFGAGTATDFILQPSSGALSDPFYWGGFEVGFMTSPPWVIWHGRTANMMRQEINRGPGPITQGSRAIDASPHLYGVEHYGSSAGFRYHNDPVGTVPYGATIGQAMNVRLHNYMSGGTVQFHMARVRKAVDPPPTVSLGAVEPRP